MIFLSVSFCSISVYFSVIEKYWKFQKNTEISDLFQMSGKCLEILARCLEKNQKLELVNDMKYAPEKTWNVYQEKTDKLRLKNSEFFIRIKMN